MSRWPPEPVEVEVIIPVFNDPERLNLCLLDLAQQSVSADRFAVTVVDNGSDQLPQLPPLPYAVRLLQCLQQGSYAARNTAIAASSTPLLAFTDADCRPSPTWIETGLAQAESFHLLAGAIRMRPCSAVTPSAADRYELLFGMQQQHYVRAGDSESPPTSGCLGPWWIRSVRSMRCSNPAVIVSSVSGPGVTVGA